ncbi:hypothetical protein PSPO01_01117 [Paraphaeosphaeria sporulosa]
MPRKAGMCNDFQNHTTEAGDDLLTKRDSRQANADRALVQDARHKPPNRHAQRKEFESTMARAGGEEEQLQGKMASLLRIVYQEHQDGQWRATPWAHPLAQDHGIASIDNAAWGTWVVPLRQRKEGKGAVAVLWQIHAPAHDVCSTDARCCNGRAAFQLASRAVLSKSQARKMRFEVVIVVLLSCTLRPAAISRFFPAPDPPNTPILHIHHTTLSLCDTQSVPRSYLSPFTQIASRPMNASASSSCYLVPSMRDNAADVRPFLHTAPLTAQRCSDMRCAVRGDAAERPERNGSVFPLSS